jgi:hypothetical protein
MLLGNKISDGLKINIVLDHEEHLNQGLSKAESIRKICREWLLTNDEATVIIAEDEAEYNEDKGEIA